MLVDFVLIHLEMRIQVEEELVVEVRELIPGSREEELDVEEGVKLRDTCSWVPLGLMRL